MVPKMVPVPPRVEVPPTTTAVMTTSSKPAPMPDSMTDCWGIMTKAATAVRKPRRVKVMSLMRVEEIRALVAAVGLPPTAWMRRPRRVRWARKSDARTTVAATQRLMGRPVSVPVPRVRRLGGRSVIQAPAIAKSVMPRRMVSIPSVAMMEGMRPRVMRMPLRRPMAEPARRVAAMTRGTGRP